jgi:hypothetical protein
MLPNAPAIGLIFLFHNEGGFLVADDKKNTPDAEKVDEPTKARNTEPSKVSAVLCLSTAIRVR